MRVSSMLSGAVLALASLATQPAAATDNAAVLNASTPWHLDYAVDKCALKRVFGEGESKLQFQIEQSGLEPYYNLSLYGQAVKKTRGEVMIVKFGPNEGATERSFIFGDLKASKTPFILMHGIHLAPANDDVESGEFTVVEIGPERERAITSLTLSRGIRKPITLELGSMAKPLEAMRTCVEELVTSLKLDEDGLAEMATGPVPKNINKLARFIQERYPSRMLRSNEGGTVAVRLTVNPEGLPTSCQIAKSNRPAVFDDYVCFGMLRIAEFEPAVGPDGQPRFGVYSTKVTYRVN